ncbi:MAG: permease [Candidatus Polarisedimenticolia bacterium]|nr:permease [bacterium]
MNARLRSSLVVAAAFLALLAALRAPSPEVAGASLRNWLGGLGELLAIIPAVLVLVALFDVWVPKEVVERGLGPASGLKGVAFALLLGTAAAGPIYAAFPIGLSLREKGARTANLVIFLGAWGTIKIPMLMLESAFLGPRFAVLRLALTLPGIVACGFLMERLERRAAARRPVLA